MYESEQEQERQKIEQKMTENRTKNKVFESNVLFHFADSNFQQK